MGYGFFFVDMCFELCLDRYGRLVDPVDNELVGVKALT